MINIIGMVYGGWRGQAWRMGDKGSPRVVAEDGGNCGGD